MPRADLYSKKVGDLLLKGWKMTAQPCPITSDVPLMQHPTSGRLFSIAVGKYTDEMDADALHAASTAAPPAPTPASADARGQQQPIAASPSSPADADADAPAAVATAAAPAAAVPAAPSASTRVEKKESDVWCDRMSELMLKGWKMLGENCPHTGAVPLMQHPTTKRKFSVATGRYIDEVVVGAAALAAATPAAARAAAPAAARPAAASPTAPAHAAEASPEPPRDAASAVQMVGLVPAPAATTQVQPADVDNGSLPEGWNLHAARSLQEATRALCIHVESLTTTLGSGNFGSPPLHAVDALAKCADGITALQRARRELER